MDYLYNISGKNNNSVCCSLESRYSSASLLTEAGGLAGGEVEAVLRQARPGAWVLGAVVGGGGDGHLGAGAAAAVAVQLQTVVLRLQLLDFDLRGLWVHMCWLKDAPRCSTTPVENVAFLFLFLQKEKCKACTIKSDES